MFRRKQRLLGIMRGRFDIGIIGGGIIGMALARALATRGAKVAVIDAGATIPAATNAAAGMLAPSFECGGATTQSLQHFSMASLAAWPTFAASLEEETGIEIDYQNNGILGVFYDDIEWSKARKTCENLRQRGSAVDVMTGEEARRIEPALSNKVIGAMHARQDGQVDPRKALIALRAGFAKTKGEAIAGRVVQVSREEGGYILETDQGDHIAASKIVLASGVAAKTALIPGLEPPPIFAVKGDAVALSIPDNLLRKVVRAPGAYLCPKAGRRLVIGASEAPYCEDLTVDQSATDGLVRNGTRAVPALRNVDVTERWAGLRPATPDGAPLLGRDPDGPEDVFLALGHYRNGVLLAPESAEVLAEELIGSGAVRSATMEAFRPDRFRQMQQARQCRV